jgi:hypothetical protein
MIDPRKAAEATRQIQEQQRRISTNQANIARIEREKSERMRYFDQQESAGSMTRLQTALGRSIC